MKPQKEQKLKQACKVLKEYAIYTDLIRNYVQEGMSIDEAVELAITECIRDGVLKDFLEKNRAEAFRMSIYEYDEEKHMRMEREECIKIGKEKKVLEYVKRGIDCSINEMEEKLIKDLSNRLNKIYDNNKTTIIICGKFAEAYFQKAMPNIKYYYMPHPS